MTTLDTSPTGRVLDNAWLDQFEAKFGPVARGLGRLVRPTIIAPDGKVLVWGDWSAIEARVLPWLANSRGAEKKLDVFRSNDKDPDAPDVYKINAGAIYEKPPEDIEKDERQVGKVAELSLGFGGSDGALIAMASNYGIYLGENMRKHVIDTWRQANSWAPIFWGRHTQNESYGLWGSFNQALENPDTIFEVGRVAYVYDKSYLGGTVFCGLPDGRMLTYPSVKIRDLEFENKQGDKETKRVLSYRRGYGFSGLWYGKLAENVTQATAGSLLRRLLVRLEQSDMLRGMMPVIAHTHDEAVTMCDEKDEDDAKTRLFDLMTTNDPWNEGLPLAAEVTSDFYYTKAA